MSPSVSFLPHPLPPLPLFHFLALVSFLARSKPKVPFLGFSLLRNQTETLATQANDLQAVFFFVFSAQTTVVVPGVLAETAETGNKNCCVTEATPVLRRKLRFRAFPERFCQRILSFENVDYFEISETFGGRKKKENYNYEKTNWSGVANCHCMQMNLVMSMRFIFGDD